MPGAWTSSWHGAETVTGGGNPVWGARPSPQAGDAVLGRRGHVEEGRAADRGAHRPQRGLEQAAPPRTLLRRRQRRIAGGELDAAGRDDPRRAHAQRDGHEVAEHSGGDAGALQLLGKR